jgi:hypothetical protein
MKTLSSLDQFLVSVGAVKKTVSARKKTAWQINLANKFRYHKFTHMYICCDVAVAQINYTNFKHNTQDSIKQVSGRSHEKDSSQIFMLGDMQFEGGGLDVI